METKATMIFSEFKNKLMCLLACDCTANNFDRTIKLLEHVKEFYLDDVDRVINPEHHLREFSISLYKE